MNEIIQELVGRAKVMAEETINKKISANEELCAFAKNFAELIVKECAEVASCNGHVSGFTLGDLIKEHFEINRRAVPNLSADDKALFTGIASSESFTVECAKKHFKVD